MDSHLPKKNFFHQWKPFKNLRKIFISSWKLFSLLTLKQLGGGVKFHSPCGFLKNACPKERVKPWFFVAFNNTISHIFRENLIEILQVVQKLWRIYLSILAIFINFLDLLTFLCYIILDKFFLKYEEWEGRGAGRSNWLHSTPEKTTLKNRS